MKRQSKLFFGLCAAAVLLCPELGAQNGRQNPRPDPKAEIVSSVERIYNYLNSCTPMGVADAKGKEIKDLSKIDENSTLVKGDFGINTYEWGVTYSGFLKLSEVLSESKYADYAFERMEFLGSLYPYVRDYYTATGYPMRLKALQSPKWLDDCGSMTAAMIKATLKDPARSRSFRPLLDNWYDFVFYQEYRMSDGILARHRPVTNSVWLDDMYMGITPIAYRAALSQKERGDLTQKYYNDAVTQVQLFKKYLWVPEKSLFRHGWIESMEEHPDYHWARANGWAVLTLCDVLDVLPERAQGRDEILSLLKDLLRGISAYQAPDGRWHQLIDKTESYLETSASAMFVYGYAHAINKGWIDRTAYQDIAKAGWRGVASQINELGQVENTCVGTGLGWTNTFYENRPVSVYAAHGYGPVLLAAAEMITLYSAPAPAPKGAYMPYSPVDVGVVGKDQRQEGKKVLFLAGDSTCKNGRGTGDNGQWGWGSFFQEYMSDSIVVENDAVGGLSSRTFYDNNWVSVRDRIRKGDYVIIQFGHNDVAPLGTGRARGTLDGTGDKAQKVVLEKNGRSVDVYPYGYYIRMMVRQARMRGATPIVISPTPLNRWKDGKVSRYDETFNEWCREVAEQEGVLFIDINELIAREYDAMGEETARKDYFADSVHTREKGARLYCETIARALKESKSPISKFVK